MSAARKTTQTFFVQILIYAQGLVLTPIIIKVAGPEVFGSYVLLMLYLGVMFGISSMGVGISAKRRLPSTDDKHDRADLFFPQFWFQILIISCLALVSVILYTFLWGEEFMEFAGSSAALIPFYLLSHVIFSQASDYFRYTHRIGFFNIITVTQPYLYTFIALAIYYVLDMLTVGSLVASTSFAYVFIGVIFFRYIYQEVGIQFRLPERQWLGKEIRLGFPLILSYLMDVILSGGDRVVIAAMLSVRDVGFYVPAYTLGSLLLLLPRVIGVVLPPILSRQVDAGDEEGAKRLSTGAVRVFLLVSIPYVFGAVFLGQDILRIYTTDEIAKVAWPIISIIALACIFNGLILIKSNILFVRLRTGVLFKINAIIAVLNIILNVVLLKLFNDVVVAAIATLISYILCYFLLSRVMKGDSVDFEINFGSVFRIMLASGGMGLALIGLTNYANLQGIAAIGFGIVMGGAVYVALLWVQPVVRSEIVSFVKAIRTK